MELILITATHKDAYRTIRLAALRTDPDAFCSTYEREVLLSDDEWSGRVSSLDGVDRIGFLALKADEPCGLILCFRDGKERSVGEVISMFVRPAERRSDVGTQLLEAVSTWAQNQAVDTLRLLVTKQNQSAIKFYEQNGFERTERNDPSAPAIGLGNIEMSKLIAGQRETL